MARQILSVIEAHASRTEAPANLAKAIWLRQSFRADTCLIGS
jgi:hypothetical protein